MSRVREALLFFGVLVAVLVFQFADMFREGHYLYLAVLEDPASLLSLYPWDVFSAGIIRSGGFPLWNHLSGTGMPHLANLQSSVLNPLKWPFFAWPSLRVLDAMIVARIALAGTFTYLFTRALGLSRSSAALAGLAFSLSGYVMKHMNQVSLAGEMWLPLLLLLIHKQGMERRLYYFILSSMVFALVFCSGNPEAAFYVSFLVLLYAVFLGAGRMPLPSWLAVGFLGPFVLGAVLACVQLVPFVEYLGAGWHIHDPSLHQMGAHSPRFITTLVAPWVGGTEGHSQYPLLAPYLGACVLFLALAGAAAFGRTRQTAFFIAAVAVLLSLVYSVPPIGFISHVPPFNRSGNAKFAMAGVSLFTALLSGHGLESIRRGTYRSKQAAPWLGLVSMLIISSGAYSILRLHSFSLEGFLTPFLSISAVGFILLFQQRRRSKEHTAAWRVAVVLVCVIELLVCFRGYDISSAYDPAQVRYSDPEPPPELAPVIEAPGHPRFTGTKRGYGGNYHHHSLNLLYKVSDIRAFEAMYPRGYVEAMGEIEGFSMQESVDGFKNHGWSFDISDDNMDHPLVDRLGVKYIISQSELFADGFELVREGRYRVYRNRGAMPRLFFEEAGKEAQICHYSACRVTVEAGGPGRLVLADTGFPGWRARQGDKELKMAPGLLKSIELGEGSHRIEFTYEPAGFAIGLWMSLSALVSLAVFGVMIKRFGTGSGCH